MSPTENKSVLSLALLYAMRMLGLFMILPIFMLFGEKLEGATPVLMGIAVGAYGLSQAILQIPYGMLSDKFGRKPLIVFGLFLFFLGSAVAAMSTSIYGVIAGRFLQGAGAIASVLMALLSDLTSEENRTKGMAFVGMTIGISFSIAMVLGPIIGEWGGLEAVFWLTAIFAILGIFIVMFVVPTPTSFSKSRDVNVDKGQFSQILQNPNLLRLDWGIFSLHFILTAMFLVVPTSLQNHAGIDKIHHWWIYLSVMVTSFFAMIPFVIIAEKKRKMKQVFCFAVLMLSLAALSIKWTQFHVFSIWLSLFFFFMAFNLLEATLPSLVSKESPAGARGTAMGVYSTSQFLGAFLGGALGGEVIHMLGGGDVYFAVSVIGIIWFLVASFMREPSYSSSFMVKLKIGEHSGLDKQIYQDLIVLEGVEEAVILSDEDRVYLKVDKKVFDPKALSQFSYVFNE
jgi:MFS family permease